MKSRLSIIVFLFLVPGFASGQIGEYTVDAAASSFTFEVEHFGVATVKGHFAVASGSIRYDVSMPDSLSARISVDVASVDTGNSLRDRELRSEDFLDARRYPTVEFTSMTIDSTRTLAKGAVVRGNMTMYGTTRTMEIPYTASLNTTSNQVTIQSSFTLNRKEFDMKFGILMDSLIGNEIRVSTSIVGIPK